MPGPLHQGPFLSEALSQTEEYLTYSEDKRVLVRDAV
jgi:hypothetical protein